MAKHTINIQEAINRNRAAGYHFFEESTMRFFRSRIMSPAFKGENDSIIFVTSEKFDHRTPRRYSVRKMKASGDVDTVGKFQQYGSRSAAMRAAERIAKGEDSE